MGLLIGRSTPDPRALFERAAAEIQRVPVFEYTFEYRDLGADGSIERALSGEALIERLDLSGRAYRARISGGEIDPATGQAISTLEVAHRGDEVYALDEREATIWFSSLYAAGPILLAKADPALMYPFFDPRSLAGEAVATEVRLEGRRRVAGTRCTSVRVAYDDDEEDSRWCFGDDGLPRRMEWTSAEGSRALEISGLKLSEAAPDERFVLEVLEPASLRDVHAAVLRLPAVVRLLADPVLVYDILDPRASLDLAQHSDDLLLRVLALAHPRLLSLGRRLS